MRRVMTLGFVTAVGVAIAAGWRDVARYLKMKQM
jgi:hypothetical protein